MAVPGDLVAQSIADLERFGLPQRGWLGASLISLDELPPSSSGPWASPPPRGRWWTGWSRKPRGQGRPQRGPAGHPGRLLALGDVILAVDGVAVKDKADVVRLVAQRRPGDRVRLTLWRDRRRLEVTVVLMARPRE